MPRMSRWMPVFVCALAAAALPTQAPAQTPHVSGAGPERPAIWREAAALLEHGASVWNAGNLDDFVSDYVPDATFVTSRGLVRGTAEIRQGYATRYFAPGAVRDTLTFRLLDVELLAPRVAHVVGTYFLTRGDSVTSTGPTSLVLKKVGGRWRIAHDHSS